MLNRKTTSLDKIEIIIDSSGYKKNNNSYNNMIMILHGLGASGNDFADLPQIIQLPQGMTAKYILPHAPRIPVTINNSFPMPAWYDITKIDFERSHNPETLNNSCALLKDIIIKEINGGIKAKNIIVGGFSQGGAMAFELAKNLFDTTKLVLGGIFILSSYLLNPNSWEETTDFKKIPIFMAHGFKDEVVKFELGEKSHQQLKENSFKVEWKKYPTGHTVSKQEIVDLNEWINKVWL